MSEIEKGDWVTINGKGPYEVESLGGRAATDEAPRRLVLKVGIGRTWVLGEWCVKVPAPFRPEPGTLWADSGTCVWTVTEDGTHMRMLGNMDVILTCERIQSTYGPLTELVRKEPPTETHDKDTRNRVFDAIHATGLSFTQVNAAIAEMENRGILFRERADGWADYCASS